ncbi:EF-hand domain-containing protein [Xanthomonas fragariae]|uniref:EF-hand domain-containing protein n=1 Tax=Xanthomonas fragariae TaxID=48664 RepID=UPI001ABEC59F|nr:EF-hand domain-containing protein [Xanthomonas fragariae]UKR54240.1 EF-hand domain-containing protein [Xanthomonas fragariae]
MSGPMLALAAPPKLPQANPASVVPATRGASAMLPMPMPIDPTTPATTPLLPVDASGPSSTKSGADASVAPAGTLAPHSFRNLDTDADGLLIVAEAGADPILRENFAGFDSNGDVHLSREEFASYQPGPGDAAGD